VRCQECTRLAEGKAEGWRAYRADERGDAEAFLVFYRAACAEREFGPVANRRGQPPQEGNGD